MPKESCNHLKRWFKKPAHESVYPLNCSRGAKQGIKLGFDHFSGSPRRAESLPTRGILQVPGSKARRAGTASMGGVREGRGGGSRMNATTGG